MVCFKNRTVQVLKINLKKFQTKRRVKKRNKQKKKTGRFQNLDHLKKLSDYFQTDFQTDFCPHRRSIIQK